MDIISNKLIYNTQSQSIPPIRQNLRCGFDSTNVSAGREPCQMGWYEWIGKNYCKNKTVLDIGAGMCNGIKLLRKLETKEVWGQDIDTDLQYQDEQLLIKDVSDLPSKSFDIVTCLDVIEHIIDDLPFFYHLQRIAKETIFITTPNFSRSKAQNHCHCREYTIPQFAGIFLPDELWSASPDGYVHHTQLLIKKDSFYIDNTRYDTKYNIGAIPDILSFCHSTVDGQEWPHICGIFKCN